MNCEVSPKIKRIIREMAKAKVEAGFTDANDIVDAIHDAIRDHTTLWKGEIDAVVKHDIGDIISGHGAKQQHTRTELQERLLQIRRDLKEANHPKDEQKNIQRRAQLQKMLDKVREQLRTGDFTKEKRTAPQYDEETQKLQAQYERAKLKADSALARQEYQNKSKTYKVFSTINAWRRLSILSGYTVFEHLTGAAVWRMVSAPLDQLVGELVHQAGKVIPALGKIDRAALTEGGGFQGEALAEGYKKAFSKETGQDMLDKLLHGYSDKDMLYGNPRPSNHPLIEMGVRTHDMTKASTQNFGFYRAHTNIDVQQRKQLSAAGHTPEETDNIMNSPAMMARNGAMAYAESLRAKLQGDNWFVDSFHNWMRDLERRGVGGRVVSGLASFEMPIMKIPANIIAESFSYMAGALKAFAKMMSMHSSEISSKDADYIIRNLKKQGVGIGLLTAGWAYYKYLGGLYSDDHKKNGALDYGDVDVGGKFVLSHQMLESPLWQVIQMAALAHQVYDNELAKNDTLAKQGKSTNSPAEAAITGTLQAEKALITDSPFVEAPKAFWKALSGANSVSKFLGQTASEITEPALVKQIAAARDPEKLLRRAPANGTDELKMGIPGLREQVPLQSYKTLSLDQRMNAWDEMSPSQRSSSNFIEHVMASARHNEKHLTQAQQDHLQRIVQQASE